MQHNKQIRILNSILENHLNCLPDVLKSGKSDTISLALKLISIIGFRKYDGCIQSKEFFLENFSACVEFLKIKPLSRYLKLLIRDILSFNHQQQAQILSILPNFDEPQRLTDFLIKKFNEFDEIQWRDLLLTISQLRQVDGINFVIDKLDTLTPDDELILLENLLQLKIEFGKESTRIFRDRFERCKTIDLKIAYLRILCFGDKKIAVPLIMENLSNCPEALITEAIQALIQLKLHAQIPPKFLTQYSSSTHYGLACAVAQVYALNYDSDKDKQTLKMGMNIVSFLMNEQSKEAKLAAIQAAYTFNSDPRIVDWIGSMLLSETDEKVCENAINFLSHHATDNVKQLLIKAANRDQPKLKVLALKSLAKFEDSQLFDFLVGEAKRSITDVAIVSAAIGTMSRAIPPNKEQIYEEFLRHTNPDVQKAAIEGLMNWHTENLKHCLERVYQTCSGVNKSLAACVLFRLGIPYILDDLLQMLESSQMADKKVALQAIHGIFKYLHETPVSRFPKELISILEVHYREAEARVAKEDVLLDFYVEEVLTIRHLYNQGEFAECERFIESVDSTVGRSFYVSMAKMWIQQGMNLDINSEECLRLTSQSPDCFLPYEMLNRQYKKSQRKTEYLVNQLRLLESRQKYYQEILNILEDFSQEDIKGSTFKNLIKILKNGSLPLDHGIHHLFVQIYVKLGTYHKAFKHLSYGFLTMKQTGYLVELATSCMRCGHLEKASEICEVGSKLESNDAVRHKLKILSEKIELLRH